MTSSTFSGGRRDRLRAGVAVLALTVALSGTVTAVARADQMVGRHMVKGQIEVAYFATGGPASWGNPLIAESNAARGGKFQTFARDTSFYWNGAVDGGNAHQVGGAIRAKWGQEGWERGPLGYPTSDEIRALTPLSGITGQVTGAMNNFQGGVIYWSPRTGAWPVWGGILTKWDAAKRESGKYGYPIGPEMKNTTGWSQQFQHGVISWP